MMTLGPVISHQQHALSRPRRQLARAACERAVSDLMNQCSRQQAGTTSQQRSTLPVHRQGHDLAVGLPEGAREATVLTCQRLPDPSLPDGRPVSSH
jgi:hypothetical protein